MTCAVEWRRVTKDFVTGLRGARLRAVNDLTLAIEEGQVFGLLGANGSGKSTALKILLGLAEPTAGSCLIRGRSSRDRASRRIVGYLPESPYFYRFLTGREWVAFHGCLAGMPEALLQGRVDEVIEWVGLTGAAERRIGTYSKGMLQRIGLAQALVSLPRVVVLDEPTAGMDADGARDLGRLLRRLRDDGVTVLLTSHVLGSIEDVCDRVAVLDHGHLVFDGAVEDLAEAEERLAFTGGELSPEDRADLVNWMGVRGWTIDPSRTLGARLENVLRENTGQVRIADSRK